MNFPSLNTIKQLNIKPRISLGQNFLIDENIADKIITASNLTQNDTVIEIGAGLGALTQKIVIQINYAYAVEIDTRLFNYLQSSIPPTLPVAFINDNILNMYFSNYLQTSQKIILIGNIPYAITTPLFLKLLEESSSIKHSVLMVQREVYERLRAKPGQDEYGFLTIFCQAYLNIKFLFKVPPQCFYPQPKIDSAVLSIYPCSDRLWSNPEEDIFRQLVTAAFAYRRKTVINCLKPLLSDLGITEAELKHHAAQEGIDILRRGESFSLAEFDKITALILQLKANC